VFLEDPHFHLNCAALADAEVAAVDLPAFLALLHESVDTCLLLLRQLSEQAERRVDDIDQLALHSGSCRVAGYLLGQLPPRRNEYLLKVPKGVLANRLAIRAETLSRILKQLSKEGILSIHGTLVRVHSREKLQRLVDEAR
jgi:CRP-like cAMP-binding protein